MNINTHHLEYPLPKLVLGGDRLHSGKLVIETTAAGTSGAITLKNTGGQTLEGTAVPSGPVLTLESGSFCANSFRLGYSVPPGKYRAGEIIHTGILLRTNGGEMQIPAVVKIVARTLEPDGAKLTGLKDFAAYARKQPAQAAAVFVSEEFANWLEEHGTAYPDIYRSLRKAPSPRLSLEAFLVLHKLKNPVTLSVRGETSREHEVILHARDPLQGSVTLHRGLWGSFEDAVRVKYASAWLVPQKDLITEHDFDGGDTATLTYTINPAKIRTSRVSDVLTIGSIEIGVKVKAGADFSCHVNNAYFKTGSRGVLVVRNLSGRPARLELSVSDSFIRPDNKDSRDIPPGETQIGFTAKLSPLQIAQMLIKKQPTITGELYVHISQDDRTFTRTQSVTIGDLE
ncbi:MAG: DUF5717 family protein [Defluviitaleaceae bacterium]|nr:DUF5717 family protein [Defluviitaleaceae bacterium]